MNYLDAMEDSAVTSARLLAPLGARVSIVVPTYNGGRLIGSTLDSVEAQTFLDWELVVYDDGSTDTTYDVRPAAHGSRIKVAEGANSGVATARNEGLALTDPRSAFVIFLDHDDVWEPEALEMLVALLDAHPEYSAAHSLARCIDVDGRPVVGDDLESWMGQRQAIRDGRLVPRVQRRADHVRCAHLQELGGHTRDAADPSRGHRPGRRVRRRDDAGRRLGHGAAGQPCRRHRVRPSDRCSCGAGTTKRSPTTRRATAAPTCASG